MIIFIGGLPGCGKSTLARALSEQLGIFHYDIDEAKKQIYPLDPDYERNIREGIPFADGTKQKAFEAVIDDFYALRKKHKHIIFDEVLQKRSQREFLYAKALRIFESKLVIHVTCREKTVKKRLLQTRENHILQQPWNVYLARKQGFDGIPEADILFENETPLPEAVVQLTKMIKEKMSAE